MTDLSENVPLDEILGISNTDTQQVLTDADIDAINEAFAEAEDLENTCETLGENLETDEVAQSCDEVAAELQDEPVGNNDKLEPDAGTVAENETVEEPEPLPWADAPENTIYYEKLYEDGHLGSFTESAEMAYKFGWYENRIGKDDVQQSDINGWTYVKDKCPKKTADDIRRDEAKARIFELKNFLTATDYKAIKYAEGALTADEYEPDRQARADARAEINRLEEAIK